LINPYEVYTLIWEICIQNNTL